MTASLIGNVFSFKPLKACRLEDIPHSGGLRQTFKGARPRFGGGAQRLDKYGRPVAGPPPPSWACRAATMVAWCTKA